MDKNTYERLKSKAAGLRYQINMRSQSPRFKPKEFADFCVRNSLVELVFEPNGVKGFYRVDPTKPWSIDNLGYDASLRPKQTTGKPSDRPIASDGAVVITVGEWVAELKAKQ